MNSAFRINARHKRNVLIERRDNINLQISSVRVKAKTRKLKTNWTPELAQDLERFNVTHKEPENVYKKILLTEKYVPKKFNTFDVEAQLVDELSRNLAQEIDRQILGNLMNLGNE